MYWFLAIEKSWRVNPQTSLISIAELRPGQAQVSFRYLGSPLLFVKRNHISAFILDVQLGSRIKHSLLPVARFLCVAIPAFVYKRFHFL
jgi:hypothetical protein